MGKRLGGERAKESNKVVRGSDLELSYSVIHVVGQSCATFTIKQFFLVLFFSSISNKNAVKIEK